MQPSPAACPSVNHLRFVFDDALVSLNLALDATFEDVARKWAELAPQHHGNPIAIDVTMPVTRGSPASRFVDADGAGLPLSI
jgi:hypothetical protein